MSGTQTSRDAQRERTRTRIRDAAGHLFAERGFDRTSIRDVAADASVDPGLVLHYFGSKDNLFRVATIDAAESPAAHAAGGTLHAAGSDPVETVLAALAAKLAAPRDHDIAQLRSMLTHPDAREHARRQLAVHAAAIADDLNGADALLRATVLTSMTLGVAIARQLLDVDVIAEASVSRIAAALRPAVHAVVHDSGQH